MSVRTSKSSHLEYARNRGHRAMDATVTQSGPLPARLHKDSEWKGVEVNRLLASAEFRRSCSGLPCFRVEGHVVSERTCECLSLRVRVDRCITSPRFC